MGRETSGVPRESKGGVCVLPGIQFGDNGTGRRDGTGGSWRTRSHPTVDRVTAAADARKRIRGRDGMAVSYHEKTFNGREKSKQVYQNGQVFMEYVHEQIQGDKSLLGSIY